MKLIWTENSNTVEKKVFLNKNFLTLSANFPKYRKMTGPLRLSRKLDLYAKYLHKLHISSTVISDELKSIESMVKGSTEMRLAFIQCVRGDGKITDLNQGVRKF